MRGIIAKMIEIVDYYVIIKRIPLLIITALAGNMETSTYAVASPFLSMLISTIFVIYKRSSIKTKKQKMNQERINVLNNEMNILNRKSDETVEQRADKILLIPDTYRYSLALDTMQRYISNMLASTWSECAKLYEEQLHRWILEGNSQEALELQHQTARSTESARKNAKTAAIFFGIATVASIATLGKISSATSDFSSY